MFRYLGNVCVDLWKDKSRFREDMRWDLEFWKIACMIEVTLSLSEALSLSLSVYLSKNLSLSCLYLSL